MVLYDQSTTKFISGRPKTTGTKLKQGKKTLKANRNLCKQTYPNRIIILIIIITIIITIIIIIMDDF